ncbi:unnamed protein product [Pleuronectes platessa]|uniref:Uncharacterized protein n=1 Tax=Pleuronectes platessa TaxID=8262 RepID=A0A9N7UK46_PLEPL|nr:unnamed protein product [Pleuronectes platessa]
MRLCDLKKFRVCGSILCVPAAPPPSCQSFTRAAAIIVEKVHLRRSRSNHFNNPGTLTPGLFVPCGSSTQEKVASETADDYDRHQLPMNASLSCLYDFLHQEVASLFDLDLSKNARRRDLNPWLMR